MSLQATSAGSHGALALAPRRARTGPQLLLLAVRAPRRIQLLSRTLFSLQHIATFSTTLSSYSSCRASRHPQALYHLHHCNHFICISFFLIPAGFVLSPSWYCDRHFTIASSCLHDRQPSQEHLPFPASDRGTGSSRVFVSRQTRRTGSFLNSSSPSII